ncbi:MAG: transglutaminase-like domain-containing protein [candidate division Zixibacteria bacterium]|nr:transglutaminase-like domain-containing protein [candidate division Zixibacteria bacterium]
MLNRLLTLALIAFFFVLNSTSAAPLKEYWLRMEQNGKAYGYEHIQIRTLDDGNLEYRYNKHVKPELRQFLPGDIVEEGTFLVTPDFRPANGMSFHYRIASPARSINMQGGCGDSYLWMNCWDDLIGECCDVEFDADNAYYDIVIPDLILLNKDLDEWKFDAFNPGEWEPDTATVKITARNDTSVSATILLRGSKINYILDTRRGIKEIEVEDSGASFIERAVDSATAINVDYLNVVSDDIGRISTEYQFRDFDRMKQTYIQFTCNMNTFRYMNNLTDNHQKCIEIMYPKRFAALLEINRPEPKNVTFPLPITGNQYSDCLGESELVRFGEEIKPLAADIVSNVTDAYEVVKNILDWISSNIEYNPAAGLQKASETIFRKQGNCGEMAILFASLARAAGIPTRFAYGEKYMTTYWHGQIWNEVWIGDWVAVDPSVGQFIAGPGHIKINSSPDYFTLQRMPTKIGADFTLDFLEFKMDSAKIE